MGRMPFETSGSTQTTREPPKDIPASQLFTRMMDRARPGDVCPYPRLDDDGNPLGEYRMQVLTQGELDDAFLDAEKYVKRRQKERAKALGENEEESQRGNQEAWREVFESAKMVEVIWRAARDRETGRPLFESPKQIRDNLSSQELTSLINAYDQVQHRFGPLYRSLTDTELEQWIQVLARGAEAALGPLGLLSPGQLVQLIVSLASRLSTSPTSKPLPGSDSDESTTG